MQSYRISEMLIWILYFAVCLSYALGNNAGLSTRIADDKHIGNSTVKDVAFNGTRSKRTPTANPQLLLPSESEITKRQFMPVVPDMPRREFLPRREFEPGNLLPTPRIIRPLEFERPGLPLERAHFMRGPLDLERRPFIGQGLMGPPLLPEFQRIGIGHPPLLREAGPRMVPLNPELEPKHVFLEPHGNHFLSSPLPRLGDDSLNFGSLGDAPIIPLAHRHHFQEGFVAPQINEPLPVERPFQETVLPEMRHQFHINPHPRPHFREGLAPPISNRMREASQLRHRLQELEQLSGHLPEIHPHATKANFAAPVESNDGTDDASETSEGDDSIESMMNELNKHKAGKAWVTDVNIYDKKRKNDDLLSFMEGDDKDDDDTADFGRFLKIIFS